MSEIIRPSSYTKVVSTIAPVISTFLRDLKAENQSLKFVYDEGESYETAINKFRAEAELEADCRDCYPLFAFKRSVLRFAEDGASRRTARFQGHKQLSPKVAQLYKTLHGEFDIIFKFYSDKAEDLERFEVTYLSEEDFSGNRKIDVPIPELDPEPWTYYLYPGPLDEQVYEVESNYYKSVSGTVKIVGSFMVMREQAKRILEINSTIQSYNNIIFKQFNISGG